MEKSFWKIGFSGAASWAWGTSLIMGQQIAQEKGIIAWIIWAICNSLTLALLGFLYNKNLISTKVFNRKEVKTIALIIQLFCLLVQLNFINQQFLKLIGNSTIAYLITILIGFTFTLIVFRKGLPTSTIDSIAVATHKIKNKSVGTIISLIMCIAWGLFVKMGMINLWSSFGVIRFAFAVGILVLPICLKGNVKVAIPISLIAFSAMVMFSVLGQISITNIAGMISFAIATSIIIWLIVISIINHIRKEHNHEGIQC